MEKKITRFPHWALHALRWVHDYTRESRGREVGDMCRVRDYSKYTFFVVANYVVSTLRAVHAAHGIQKRAAFRSSPTEGSFEIWPIIPHIHPKDDRSNWCHSIFNTSQFVINIMWISWRSMSNALTGCVGTFFVFFLSIALVVLPRKFSRIIISTFECSIDFRPHFCWRVVCDKAQFQAIPPVFSFTSQSQVLYEVS